MRIKVIGAIVAILFPISGFCQYDSIVNQMKREFNSFKKEIEQDHQNFKSKNDSVFSAFLRDSWESFQVFFKSKPEEKPKPLIQPTVPKGDALREKPKETIPVDSTATSLTITPGKQPNEPEPRERSGVIENTNETAIMVDFYGTPLSLTTTLSPQEIRNIDGKAITSYFDMVSSSYSLQQFTKKLQMMKRDRKLNDWGYLQLVRNTARKISLSQNEAELMTWVALLKSGINAKVGYTPDQIFLMVPFFEDIYVSWYIKINEKPYYILTDGVTKEQVSNLMVHRADYPGNLPLSLELNELPLLNKKMLSREFNFRNQKFTVSVNENMINFFTSYPQCSMQLFFAAPLSENVLSSLDTFLIPKMKNLTARQKVALLLEFTQKSFAYQSDREQFRREKFFFPDELFFYPFSDCEDRSILFTRLVKHFTGLKSIGLDYPKHVNTAVALGEEEEGDFIRHNKQKYLICDPTYINAPVGYLPKEYDEIKPEIINFEQNQ